MTKPTGSLVATCPDCGGIMHPVALERLTSVEVALHDTAATPQRQCLLCGYEDDPADDEAVLPA